MGNKKSKAPLTPREEDIQLMGETKYNLKKSLKIFKEGREEFKANNFVEALRYYELAYLYLDYVVQVCEDKYKKICTQILSDLALNMAIASDEIKKELLSKSKKNKEPVFVRNELIEELREEFGYEEFDDDERKIFDSITSAITLEMEYIDWSDIIGNTTAKKGLQRLADNEINPQVANLIEKKRIQRQKGMLLLGPPGTGKTYMAKAVASQTGGKVNFIDIAADKLKGKYVGESEKLITCLFQVARAIKPCIIFLGELIIPV